LDTRINAKIAALQARWGHQSTLDVMTKFETIMSTPKSFVQEMVDFSAEAPMEEALRGIEAQRDKRRATQQRDHSGY
jgi:hypothetical protein